MSNIQLLLHNINHAIKHHQLNLLHTLLQYDATHVLNTVFPFKQIPIFNAALNVQNSRLKYCMFKVLIAKGADLNIKNHQGVPLLYIICEKEELDLLILYISQGGKLTVMDEMRRNALFWITRNKNEHLLKVLLTRTQININHLDLNGNTALFSAVKQNNHKICQILLRAGCDYTRRDMFGRSAYQYANQDIKGLFRALLSSKSISKIKRKPINQIKKKTENQNLTLNPKLNCYLVKYNEDGTLKLIKKNQIWQVFHENQDLIKKIIFPEMISQESKEEAENLYYHHNWKKVVYYYLMYLSKQICASQKFTDNQKESAILEINSLLTKLNLNCYSSYQEFFQYQICRLIEKYKVGLEIDRHQLILTQIYACINNQQQFDRSDIEKFKIEQDYAKDQANQDKIKIQANSHE